jgi:hypothetical protein
MLPASVKSNIEISVNRRAILLTRTLAFLVAIWVLSSGAAWAFTHRLVSEQVREAYFVGQNVDNRQAFFDQYVHYPKAAERGPDVHLIEFRTPYEQVARRSQERWANYHALDAEEDYARHPNEVIVRVLLCGTMTFGFGTPPDDPAHAQSYLHGFHFQVSQVSGPIEYKELTLDHTLGDGGCAGEMGGAEVFLHFDPDQFGSGDVKIDVTVPGGQVFATTFDIDYLK